MDWTAEGMAADVAASFVSAGFRGVSAVDGTLTMGDAKFAFHRRWGRRGHYLTVDGARVTRPGSSTAVNRIVALVISRLAAKTEEAKWEVRREAIAAANRALEVAAYQAGIAATARDSWIGVTFHSREVMTRTLAVLIVLRNNPTPSLLRMCSVLLAGDEDAIFPFLDCVQEELGGDVADAILKACGEGVIV